MDRLFAAQFVAIVGASMVKRIKGEVDFPAVQKQLAGIRTEVGYLPGKEYPDGTPVAYIAAIHEYGSPSNGIPPRPTLHPSLDQARGKLSNILIGGIRSAIGGGSVDAAFEAVGLAAQGIVRGAIADLKSPALSDATVKRRASRHHAGKASNKPLVDSGTMLGSVEYSVVRQ